MEINNSELLLQDDYGDELNITDISLRYLKAEESNEVTQVNSLSVEFLLSKTNKQRLARISQLSKLEVSFNRDKTSDSLHPSLGCLTLKQNTHQPPPPLTTLSLALTL